MPVHHVDGLDPDVLDGLVAVLEHRAVGRRRRQLAVELLLDVGVRDDGQVVGPGERRHLEPLVDAQELGGVRLDDPHGARLDVVAEGVLGEDRLSHRHGDRDGLLELGVGLDVLGHHGLLEPVHVEVGELAAPEARRVQGPGAVHVGHDPDLRAHSVPHRADAVVVLARVLSAELDLDRVEAAVDEGLRVAHQVLLAPGQPAAVSAVGEDLVPGGAEVVPEGHSGPLALDVPEGELHGRDTDPRGAHAAHEVVREEHLLHERLAERDVLADEHRRVVLLHHHLRRAQARGVGPVGPHTDHARVGMQTDREELHLVHLALGVGDLALLERDAQERGLHLGDLGAHGLWRFNCRGRRCRGCPRRGARGSGGGSRRSPRGWTCSAGPGGPRRCARRRWRRGRGAPRPRPARALSLRAPGRRAPPRRR